MTNFCLRPVVIPGSASASQKACNANQEVLIEKLFDKIEKLEEGVQQETLQKINARLSKLERKRETSHSSVSDQRIKKLEKKVKTLCTTIEDQLPALIEQLAALAGNIQNIENNHNLLSQDITNIQQGQATDLSQILATLVTVATHLANHDGQILQSNAVLNNAFNQNL